MPKPPPPDRCEGLPVVTAERMRELDRAAVSDFGLAEADLMENAGRAVAQETLRFGREELSLEPAGLRVAVCCGRGANGGDGLVAARHLREMGAEVSVFICPPKKDGDRPGQYMELVRSNLEKALKSGVSVQEAAEDLGSLMSFLAAANAALDALLGTGSSGKPAGLVRKMIQALMKSGRPILAVDIPSGIHPDTGHHSGVFIAARETFALGLAKRGLVAPHAAKNVGRLKVLDIGYPKDLIARFEPFST